MLFLRIISTLMIISPVISASPIQGQRPIRIELEVTYDQAEELGYSFDDYGIKIKEVVLTDSRKIQNIDSGSGGSGGGPVPREPGKGGLSGGNYLK
jgi:hypothetical protein